MGKFSFYFKSPSLLKSFFQHASNGFSNTGAPCSNLLLLPCSVDFFEYFLKSFDIAFDKIEACFASAKAFKSARSIFSNRLSEDESRTFSGLKLTRLFDLNPFEDEKTLCSLLNGEEMGLSGKWCYAGDMVYGFITCRALLWQHSSKLSVLGAPQFSPPKYYKSLFKKIFPECTETQQAFLRRLALKIHHDEIFIKKYDLLIAEMPISLPSTFAFDDNARFLFENPYVEFLHKCSEMLSDNGQAHVIIPPGIKKTEAFRLFRSLKNPDNHGLINTNSVGNFSFWSFCK